MIWKLLLITLLIDQGLSWNPIVLVPGYLSSQIQAEYIDRCLPRYCGKLNKNFTLWVNLIYIFPFEFKKCLVESMKLNYNNLTHTTSNPEFIKTFIPGFGKVDTIDYLSPYRFPEFVYFNALVEYFVKYLGYTKNVDIRGAPYDFRKGLNELSEYMEDLRNLIEDTYRTNGNKPVILIAHSMGNLNIMHLLNNSPSSWKKKYISAFFCISAPFGGSVDALLGILSGTLGKHNVAFLPPSAIQPDLSSWPSSYQLAPNSQTFKTHQIILTDTANYTSVNFHKLFTVSKIPNAKNLYQDVSANGLLDFQAPGVPFYCISSRNVSTIVQLDYRGKSFPADQPRQIKGDGDGAVNSISLDRCVELGNNQLEPHYNYVFDKINHRKIIQNPHVLQLLDKLIRQIS